MPWLNQNKNKLLNNLSIVQKINNKRKVVEQMDNVLTVFLVIIGAIVFLLAVAVYCISQAAKWEEDEIKNDDY